MKRLIQISVLVLLVWNCTEDNSTDPELQTYYFTEADSVLVEVFTDNCPVKFTITNKQKKSLYLHYNFFPYCNFFPYFLQVKENTDTIGLWYNSDNNTWQRPDKYTGPIPVAVCDMNVPPQRIQPDSSFSGFINEAIELDESVLFQVLVNNDEIFWYVNPVRLFVEFYIR